MSQTPLSVHPNVQDLRAFRNRLPIFKPHDLRKLLELGRSADQETAVVFALRIENDKQIAQLLRAMGLEPTAPEVWRRAFFMLATIHHGVGQIAWRPRRPTQNAAKWRPEHEEALSREMSALRDMGLNERQAIEKLAIDPRKLKLFPYRAQNRPGSRMGAKEQRIAAPRARWQNIKRRQKRIKRLLRSRTFQDAFGVEPHLSSFDLLLMHLDGPRLDAVKIENRPNTPRS